MQMQLSVMEMRFFGQPLAAVEKKKQNNAKTAQQRDLAVRRLCKFVAFQALQQHSDHLAFFYQQETLIRHHVQFF